MKVTDSDHGVILKKVAPKVSVIVTVTETVTVIMTETMFIKKGNFQRLHICV